MSLALTCDCGARFEVQDLFAEQEVNCPECQAKLRAPRRSDDPAPVSLLALFSLVLAVVGAFTLVGSAAGLLLAGVALLRIHLSRGHIQGAAYAVAAIVVAIVGVGLTMGVLFHPQASALTGWLRTRTMASQLDTELPPQVGSRDNACVLARPPGWGRLRGDHGLDPTIEILQTKRDLLLCSARGEAYIDIQRDASGTTLLLEDYANQLVEELKTPPPELFQGEEENFVTGRQAISVRMREQKKLPDVDGFRGIEKSADLRRGGRTWRWLIRAYRRSLPGEGNARAVYVVRAYVPLNRFAAFEHELRQALDSVRFPP